MSRAVRLAFAWPLLLGSVLLTGIAFTPCSVHQPPSPMWVGIAAFSITFILAAAVKGCVDWVYEGQP